ncbi:MAG: hypothetical protein KDC83_13910, partial [Flavobacteriales bacterium]|nr:hypothetical protein [Flavobacteriales bacterium]
MKYFFTAALGLFLYSAAFSQTCNCTGTDINLYNTTSDNFVVYRSDDAINTGCPNTPSGFPFLCTGYTPLPAGANICLNTCSGSSGFNFSDITIAAAEDVNWWNICGSMTAAKTLALSFSTTGTYGAPIEGCTSKTT